MNTIMGEMLVTTRKNIFFFGAKNFIKNTTEKIEKLMEVKLKNYGSPKDIGYHPDIYYTDMFFGTDITMYRMIIGCSQSEITLGRYDVKYATNNLSMFGTKHR